MNLFAQTSLLCGFLSLLLAIFSFLAGKTPSYRLLTRFNIAVMGWGFGCFFAAVAQQSSTAILAWKLIHIPGFFISTFFYHLVSGLCGRQNSKTLVFGFSQAILFNIINIFSNALMPDTRMAFGIFYFNATPLYLFAYLIHSGIVLYSFLLLVQRLRVVDGFHKRQIQYLAYGFAFGFIGGNSVLLPVFQIDLIYPIGNIGIFIYAAIVTYAVLRDKILDFEGVVELVHRNKLAAIGTLATSINHEIRNPLYVIQGLADSFLVNVEEGIYASKEAAFERANEILKKTRDQATRAMDIMKRFAVFAKQGVSQQANIQAVDLNGLFEDVLPLVRHELELDKIKFEKDVPQDFPALQADRRHLEEILFNLIVNACQALKLPATSCKPQANEKTSSSFKPQAASESDFPEAVSLKPAACDLKPETKPRIEISASQFNGHVNILISDNGPGIPAKQLKQIFEPFYTTKQEGTGLGLYITKQLVERNGGKISVKSKPGEGTCFKLEFARK